MVSCSNRSEYGLVRPILFEFGKHPALENRTLSVKLILYSSAASTCFDDVVRDFGNSTIEIILLANTEASQVESLNSHFGRLVNQFSQDDFFFCDMLLVAGDRYESFALAQAAFYQHIPIAHMFGGDISNGGHFDDHIRHALTHLSSVHFPVNKTARENLLAMHQEISRIFLIGSPVVDDLSKLDKNLISSQRCDVLISFNPMTLDSTKSVSKDLRITLEALQLLQSEIQLHCVATPPNNEPGFQEINELYNEFKNQGVIEIVESLGSPQYLYAIRDSQIVIGNSSSQVLEVPLLGRRCLLIGNRQKGRHKPKSVVHITSLTSPEEVKDTLLSMLHSNPPAPCKDYGEPGVSHEIVHILYELLYISRDCLVQKNMPLQIVKRA